MFQFSIKSGEKPNTGGASFQKIHRALFSLPLRDIFPKTLCAVHGSPGKTRKNYDTHETAGRVSFREFVNSASKIGMESLISYPVNVSPIGEIVAI